MTFAEVAGLEVGRVHECVWTVHIYSNGARSCSYDTLYHRWASSSAYRRICLDATAVVVEDTVTPMTGVFLTHSRQFVAGDVFEARPIVYSWAQQLCAVQGLWRRRRRALRRSL